MSCSNLRNAGFASPAAKLAWPVVLANEQLRRAIMPSRSDLLREMAMQTRLHTD